MAPYFKIDSGIGHPPWRPNGSFRTATGDVRLPQGDRKDVGHLTGRKMGT